MLIPSFLRITYLFRQNINKKLTRRVHRKKQAAYTHDTLFDDLYRQFEMKQEMARQFEKGVQDWILKVKDNVNSLSDLIQNLDIIYGDSDGIGLRTIGAFKQLTSQLSTSSMVIKLNVFICLM